MKIIVVFAMLIYIIGGVFALSGFGAVKPRIPQESSSLDSLRVELARLKKEQKIERGVCAVVTGFTLWRFIR